MVPDYSIEIVYIDLFCGAGGTSTGIEKARINGQKIAIVGACINHDRNAIASHAANHIHALHFTEDIRTLDLTELAEYMTVLRKRYPRAKFVLWASLECTNHSKAKGGMSRAADSRTLGSSLYMKYSPSVLNADGSKGAYRKGDSYIQIINPDYVQLENVEEFKIWGPLKVKESKTEEGYMVCPLEVKKIGKGKLARTELNPVYVPISERKGEYFKQFVDDICALGYTFDHRTLDSADYGAYTSRRRFFAQFAKEGLPIEWPEPTHSKKPKDSLLKWKPVRDVLDFDDEGVSIFNRNKPLSDKTLERIYAGLIKFVAGGKSNFLSKYYSGNPDGKNISTEGTAGTITCVDHHSLVSVNWMLKYNSINGKTGIHNPPSLDDPCPVVSTQSRLGVIKCDFITRYNSGEPHSRIHSIDQPLGTITTSNRFSKVNCDFLSAYYSTGDNCSSVDSPAPTITTKDRLAKVSPRFIDMQYGNGYAKSIDEPAGTVTTNPKHNLVTCSPWLLNPQYNSAGGDINSPCFTLIARMDKAPPYLVIAKSGDIEIVIGPSDSLIMQKIKEFMVLYRIIDIKMRMLKISELKVIMGFPSDYVLIGKQDEQKKYIGNAVEVETSKALCISTALGLRKLRRIAI